VVGGSVTATLVDQDGAPVAGQPAYICGLNLCSPPASTNAQGQVSLSTTLTMKRPAFKVGDATTVAELAVPLTSLTAAFGTITTARLPSSGATLAGGTTATSGAVSLAIPAGASIGIDTLLYDTPASQQLRVASIPLPAGGAVFLPAAIDGQPAGFGLVYGLAPAETVLCPRAKLTVALPHLHGTPNDLGWAAGARVEVWVMTTDVGQTWAPYAGWAKESDGVVSADGASLSTLDGQGLGFLQTFAVRLQP
jgi:hypothetical protein